MNFDRFILFLNEVLRNRFSKIANIVTFEKVL